MEGGWWGEWSYILPRSGETPTFVGSCPIVDAFLRLCFINLRTSLRFFACLSVEVVFVFCTCISRNSIMLAPLLFSVLMVGTSVVATYVPQKVICPTAAIVRAADGLSDDEETYRVARKAVADVALKSWLSKTDSGFGTGNLPTVPISPWPYCMGGELMEIGRNDYKWRWI